VPTRLLTIRLPPTEFGAALRRAWDDGAAVLPLPWDAPDAAIERTLRTLRPADGATRDDLPDDAALVIPTSGSTGPPKGVVLTHAALAASTTASIDRLGAVTGDRFTLALPVHHVAGIQILLRSWACDTDAEVMDPTGSAAQALTEATGDHLSLVPTQLQRLLDAQVDLRRWRTILLGGARAAPELLHRAADAGAHVVTSYGMTETCGGCVYDGLPLTNVEVARRDDGRIKLRGPMLFAGYLGDPDATATAFDDDGWFVTGDLGTLADDGRLEVTGRHDDVIISGGENVPAGVVADVVRGDPRILDVVVVGVPDVDWGQMVVAVVIPTDLAAPPTLDDVRERVRQQLPAAYAPRRLIVADRFPVDAMGKTTVDALRSMLHRGTHR
jgi:o-succinylbenzoate---CoA ligase